MFRPSPGALVGGRYRLGSVIARGSMGEIWRAHALDLDGPCAVKLLLGHLATNASARTRLLSEGRALQRLRSPHTVRVLGAGEHQSAVYLAMELLEGEPLAARLGRGELLSQGQVLTLLGQVARALDEAHGGGIIHRDLKPDNLWLCRGHELLVKILDFGLARDVSQPGQPALSGALVGTPHYMSPEQARAERDVDHRSDLWSLAIIAVQCLTGRRPFEARGTAPLLLALTSQPPPPLLALGPQLPAALEAWWQRALHHDPEQRFQSASELVDVLRRGLPAIERGVAG